MAFAPIYVNPGGTLLAINSVPKTESAAGGDAVAIILICVFCFFAFIFLLQGLCMFLTRKMK